MTSASVSEVHPVSDGEVCALQRSHRGRFEVELSARSWCSMMGEITRHLQSVDDGFSEWRLAVWPIVACAGPLS